MILYGTGTDIYTLRDSSLQFCRACDDQCRHSVILQYDYFHLYYLGVTMNWKYFVVCNICQRGYVLDPKEAKALTKAGELDTPSIPPLRRYGMLFAVVMAILILLARSIGWIYVLAGFVALVLCFILPGIIKGIKRRGFRGYTKEASAAFDSKPITLFGPSSSPKSRDSKDEKTMS